MNIDLKFVSDVSQFSFLAIWLFWKEYIFILNDIYQYAEPLIQRMFTIGAWNVPFYTFSTEFTENIFKYVKYVNLC